MSYKTYEVRVYDNGSKSWYLDRKRHREDGPAVELADGTKEWYLDGRRHREDGPALEYVNGNKCWYLNDKLHREDGPAVEYADGTKRWFLDGAQFAENEWKQQLNKQCEGQVVEINGVKYKLQKVGK
jgi:hypothetical protein